MAGPTPVSALIHAATMVTAGVYMVARCNVFYRLSPTAMLVVAIVGGVTAIFAATIGLVQNDIKKVLAYSTVSQLGYMFLGAGVGAFVAAIFHVVTHAFFKACLFLGSGSVIHACGGEQDMRKMGGLKKYMPITYWTFLVATLAISGIFRSSPASSPRTRSWPRSSRPARPTSTTSATSTTCSGYLAVVGAVLTAFYMFRLVYMTFHGEFRGGEEAEHHLHESPWTMTLPLVILGVLSIVGGLIGFPGKLFHHPEWNLIERFLEPVMLPVGHGEVGLSGQPSRRQPRSRVGAGGALSVAVAAFGIWLAYRFYMGARGIRERPRRLAERFPFAYKLLLNKYWVDEIYDATVISGTVKGSRFLWEFDARVVDGAVNGTAPRHGRLRLSSPASSISRWSTARST